jgi:hypothetical protein
MAPRATVRVNGAHTRVNHAQRPPPFVDADAVIPLEGHAAEAAFYVLDVSLQAAMRDPEFATETAMYLVLRRMHKEYMVGRKPRPGRAFPDGRTWD